MSRYIDADALKERLIQNITLTNAIDRSFSEAPSIDVVFCKECKYYEAKEDWCYWRDEAITADGFCNYGGREGE